MEVRNLVVLGHGAGLSPPGVAGAGDELDARLVFVRDNETKCSRTGTYLHPQDSPACGIPTVHHSSLAELEPLCP